MFTHVSVLFPYANFRNYTGKTVCCGLYLKRLASASRTVDREFASRPGHTEDHKNGTNFLSAWHAMR